MTDKLMKSKIKRGILKEARRKLTIMYRSQTTGMPDYFSSGVREAAPHSATTSSTCFTESTQHRLMNHQPRFRNQMGRSFQTNIHREGQQQVYSRSYGKRQAGYDSRNGFMDSVLHVLTTSNPFGPRLYPDTQRLRDCQPQTWDYKKC